MVVVGVDQVEVSPRRLARPGVSMVRRRSHAARRNAVVGEIALVIEELGAAANAAARAADCGRPPRSNRIKRGLPCRGLRPGPGLARRRVGRASRARWMTPAGTTADARRAGWQGGVAVPVRAGASCLVGQWERRRSAFALPAALAAALARPDGAPWSPSAPPRASRRWRASGARRARPGARQASPSRLKPWRETNRTWRSGVGAARLGVNVDSA